MLVCRCFGIKLIKHLRPTVVIILTFFVLMLSAVISDEAIAKTGLSVCPSSLSFKTPPGFSETRVFKLSNSGSEEIVVNIKPAVTTRNKEGNTVYKTSDSENDSSAILFNVKPSRIALKPRATVYVKLMVSVPPHMNPGDYKAAILFNVGDADTSRISIASRIVSSVSLHIESVSAVPRFEVESFEAGRINIGGPLEFKLNVQNVGKTPYKTHGNIKIISGDDKQVAEIVIPNINIPPGSSRDIAIKSKTVLSSGIYRCSMFLENSGYFKGPYTKTLVVFPWLGLLGLVMIAISLYLVRLRPKKKPRLQSFEVAQPIT